MSDQSATTKNAASILDATATREFVEHISTDEMAAHKAPWWVRDHHSSGTFASYFSISIFLASFAILINNTAKTGEPKVATAMIIISFAFTIWSTAVFFQNNWRIQNRAAMASLLTLVILFLLLTIWLCVRMWVTF
jgi:hypothetical protein